MLMWMLNGIVTTGRCVTEVPRDGRPAVLSSFPSITPQRLADAHCSSAVQ